MKRRSNSWKLHCNCMENVYQPFRSHSGIGKVGKHRMMTASSRIGLSQTSVNSDSVISVKRKQNLQDEESSHGRLDFAHQHYKHTLSFETMSVAVSTLGSVHPASKEQFEKSVIIITSMLMETRGFLHPQTISEASHRNSLAALS